jgi:hypothetical protein
MIVEEAGTNPQALLTGSLNMQAYFAVRRHLKLRQNSFEG